MSDPARIGPPAPQEPVTMINLIARAAFDPNADVAKLQALLAMQAEFEARELERQQREARRLYNEAMGKAQAAMRPVVRSAANTQTRSRYAKLETIDEAIRPIYVEHGFVLSYGTVDPKLDGRVRVTCDCAHDGGHVERYELEAPLDVLGPRGERNKTDLHGLGSTVSYLRRYLKILIFDIALINEDDDGNKGGGSIASGAAENARTTDRRAWGNRQTPPSKRRTYAEWLDDLENDCRNCLSPEDANAILDDPTVKRMESAMAGQAKARCEQILAELTARFFIPEDGAGNGEDHTAKDGKDGDAGGGDEPRSDQDASPHGGG